MKWINSNLNLLKKVYTRMITNPIKLIHHYVYNCTWICKKLLLFFFKWSRHDKNHYVSLKLKHRSFKSIFQNVITMLPTEKALCSYLSNTSDDKWESVSANHPGARDFPRFFGGYFAFYFLFCIFLFVLW